MGPCQGGFCIYRATGILHGVDRLDGAAGQRLAAPLPRGALEGRVADPLRRPAAPGAPGRLDLPGPARRGAPAAMSRRPAATARSVLRRHRRRRRPRRADRGRRGWPRPARRSSCSPRASARRTSRPATIDVLGYAPERVERPGEALGGCLGEPTTRTRASAAPTASRAASTGSASSSTAGPLALRLHGRPRREPPAADAPSARRSRPRSCPRRWPAGDLRDGRRRCSSSASARCKDFHPALLADNLAARRRAGARGRARAARSTAAPTPTRSASRAAFDDAGLPRAAVVRQARGAARRRGERVGFPAGARRRGPATACGATCRSSSAGRCSRSRRCRRPCPGMRRLRDAARRAARARRADRAELGGGRRRRATARASTAVRATAAGRARSLPRATGSCSPPAASAAGGIALDSHWRARETALGLPRRRRARRRASRASCPTTSTSSRWPAPGVAVDARPAPRRRRRARACSRTCSWPARRSAGAAAVEEKSGDGDQPRQRAPRGRADPGGRGRRMTTEAAPVRPRCATRSTTA